MAQLVGGRRRVLLDAHVAWVQLGDEPLDRPALARRIPALQHDAQRRAEPRVPVEPGELQTQLLHALLRPLQPLPGLLLGEVGGEVQVGEAAHRGEITSSDTRNAARSRGTSAIGVSKPSNRPAPRYSKNRTTLPAASSRMTISRPASRP